jgi:hypothetical protein
MNSQLFSSSAATTSAAKGSSTKLTQLQGLFVNAMQT